MASAWVALLALGFGLPALGWQEPAAPEAAPTGPLTLEDVFGRVRTSGDQPSVRFDGAGRVQVGKGAEQKLLDPTTLQWLPAVEPAAGETQPSAPAVGETPEADEAKAPERGWRSRGGRLELASGAAGEQPVWTAVELPEGELRELEEDPSGARLSFVLGADLFVLPLTAGAEPIAITKDGDPELLDGVLDWVYQEEIYGRGDFRGYWWSPTGDALCWLTLDEHQVPSFTVIDHVPPKPRLENRGVVVEASRYPKVGEANPTASLSIARFTASGIQVQPIDLSGFDPDLLIVRVDWAPDGSQLWFTVQDRIQTRANLVSADPQSGQVHTLIEERSPTWVNRPESPRFLKDGSFLWLSERTGYNHIYHYARDGKLIRPLTRGEWQVRSIAQVDEDSGQLWFEGTKDGAIDRNLYRVPLAGGDLVRITAGRGSHELAFSPAGPFAIDSWSALDQPPGKRLVNALDGQLLIDFGQADRANFSARQMVDPVLLEIPARDGLALDATLLLPPGFGQDPVARYPVFLDTYSGPDAPTVANRYRPSTWLQFLAQRGAIVLQVNVRTASGRGQAFTGLVYKNFLELELRDLEDAVDYVVKNYAADPARVAISGWSYGGSMTAYALTHSQKFSLGFAGAGVYDWRLYDSIYTERYMQTPDLNLEGYEKSSVINAAKDLHGYLVLMHGTMDDNVHLQNTIQFIDELERAGKLNFEVMLYPNARHGVSSPHRTRLMWKLLQREFGLEEPVEGP